MALEFAVASTWAVFVATGFLLRLRRRFDLEPLILFGLIAGGLVFMIRDIKLGRCDADISALLCSGKSAVVLGIALGAVLARICLSMRGQLKRGEKQ